MDIKQKLERLGLPVSLADGSFATTISLIDEEEAKKYLGYLAYYGITLTKASELKYLTYNEMEMNFVLTKLQYLKNNGIPVTDEEGNVKSYIFDLSKKHSAWAILYPDANLISITPDVFRDKEELKSDLLDTLNKNVTVGLTEDNYDRYLSLERTLTLVTQALTGEAIITPEMSNNLIKLLSVNGAYSDSEIIYAVLVYNQNRSADDIARIQSVIGEVIESLNQGGVLKQ